MQKKSGQSAVAGGLGIITGNAAIVLMITTMIWGGNAVAGKFAVGHVSPFLLTICRWGIAGGLLLFFARDHLRADWPVIRRNAPYLFFMGAIGFAAFNGFLYSSLVYTSAINVTILQAAMPLFIFIMNFLFFHLHLHWGQVVGYAMTLVGVIVTASAGSFSRLAALEFNIGDVIMIGGVLTYSGYSVALRKKPELHWMSFLTVMICSAALASIPLVTYEAMSGSLNFSGTAQAWIVLIFTAIFPSIMSQGLYIRGIDLIGGNAAGVYLNLVPIWGAIFAVLLLGEQFGWHHGLAIVLVIGGILLAQHISRSRSGPATRA